MHTSFFFFFLKVSRESSANQSVFSIMVYINKLILGLLSVCVSVTDFVCVCACARVSIVALVSSGERRQ